MNIMVYLWKFYKVKLVYKQIANRLSFPTQKVGLTGIRKTYRFSKRPS